MRIFFIIIFIIVIYWIINDDIDPFGSSNVSPSLWAELGFYAFVINRIDYRIKVIF